MSGAVNFTVCSWKITHWKLHITLKLKPCMCTNNESVRTFILHDIATRNQKESHNILSKFTMLCWAAFIAIQATDLDTPDLESCLKVFV